MAEYQYRKHIRIMQNALPIFFAILIVLSWGSLGIMSLAGNLNLKLVTFLGIIGIVLTFVFGLYAFLIWFILRKFTKIRVSFDGEAITYINVKGQQVIPVEDIVKLEFPSVPYMGGWLTIHSKDGSKIRLTVVLEGIGHFLRSLKEALDARGQSVVYDAQKIFSFYKTAQYADDSWERLYSIFFRLVLLSLLNVGVGFALHFFHFQNFLGIILIVISVLGTLLAYPIADLTIARRMSKGASQTEFYVPERDLEFESKLFRRTAIIYSEIYLGIVLVFCIIHSCL